MFMHLRLSDSCKYPRQWRLDNPNSNKSVETLAKEHAREFGGAIVIRDKEAKLYYREGDKIRYKTIKSFILNY